MNIDILKIRPFQDHPFKAADDEKMFKEYFSKEYTATEMRYVIENLLTEWKRRQEEEEVQIPDEVQLLLRIPGGTVQLRPDPQDYVDG